MKNSTKWTAIPRGFEGKTAAEIEQKYLELSEEQRQATGLRYYEIGNDLGYLIGCYKAQTGEYLKRPKVARPS